MQFGDFQKYQEKVSDLKGKFAMPIGWGWAYPFVKYTAMLLVSLKTMSGIPWYIFMLFSILLGCLFSSSQHVL